MQYLDLKAIKIGSIWNEGRGASTEDDFEADLDLSPEIDVKSPLTGNLQIIRMKEGVTVLMKNLHADCTLECVRCLDKFTYPVNIAGCERQFYEEVSDRDFDPMESFLVNIKNLTLDLTESLRQELILHFPINPLCSEHCLGICQVCHQNLNKLETKHLCQLSKADSAANQTNKPFANLKDLLK